MNESGLDRLLDRSVPTIPDRLRTPPIAAIRRRAGRRRVLVTSAATAGAVLALTLAGAVVTALPAARDATVTPADPTAVPDRAPLRWPLAVIGRDDRTITVYPLPAGGECMELAGVTATFTGDANRVVVTARGDSRRAADCRESGAAVPVELTLSEPLAGRVLVDAATGRPAPAYPERVLPVVPPPWREVPVTVRAPAPNGDLFAFSYSRPDPPALTILISPTGGTEPAGPPGETIAIGGRTAVLADHDRHWSLRWQAEGFTMTMNFSDDGRHLTRDRVLAVIDQLAW
ncbi:hypothetical protein [Virgisporangium ochraceum]|uniref:DUF4367 domain-containing protein n=1 Tax=Virgisporangium ochraceum TaxID=65505 RepID=A0A8J4EGJ5_9ACTN|nr:hypothetical protein [Virgisporangium ochraceum]GIJ74845.1 hypothetical protein Voc01_097620 [Virgisporangium ochraceum]